MMVKKWTDYNGWRYGYDQKTQLWRAFRGEEEINQYHKHEMLYVIEHIDNPLMDSFYTQQQVTINEQ